MTDNGNALARDVFDAWLRVWRAQRWLLRLDEASPNMGETNWHARTVTLNVPLARKNKWDPEEILLHEMGGHALLGLDDTPAAEHRLVERVTRGVYRGLDERRQGILTAMIARAWRGKVTAA